mgnify:CR=1 FL=1
MRNIQLTGNGAFIASGDIGARNFSGARRGAASPRPTFARSTRIRNAGPENLEYARISAARLAIRSDNCRLPSDFVVSSFVLEVVQPLVACILQSNYYRSRSWLGSCSRLWSVPFFRSRYLESDYGTVRYSENCRYFCSQFFLWLTFFTLQFNMMIFFLFFFLADSS